jgi:hypothetical protein
MSIPWQQVEKFIYEHRKEIGFKGAPCVRLSTKGGEKYLIYRSIEVTESLFAALAFLPEETIDENPRFKLVALDPQEIAIIEVFEPEPRRPEQLRRFSMSVQRPAVTEKLEKK